MTSILPSPHELFKDFVDEKNIDGESIMRFAERLGIDAGIVVGRLQKEGYLKYSQHHDLKTRYTILT